MQGNDRNEKKMKENARKIKKNWRRMNGGKKWRQMQENARKIRGKWKENEKKMKENAKKIEGIWKENEGNTGKWTENNRKSKATEGKWKENERNVNENERKTKGSLVGSHVGSPGVYSGGYRTYSGEGAPTKIVELHEGGFLIRGGTLSRSQLSFQLCVNDLGPFT